LIESNELWVWLASEGTASASRTVGGDEQNAMSEVDAQPAVPKRSIRWFQPTPARLLAALLVVEGLLWLSNRFGWLSWHKGYAVLTAVVLVAAALVGMIFWFGVSLIFRWRFQFSIRSLLVLVVAVAMPCSWLAVEIKKANRQREAAEGIEKLGGSTTPDTYFVRDEKERFNPGYSDDPEPLWLQEALGGDFFANVVTVSFHSSLTDTGLAHMRALTHPWILDLVGTHVTDADLEKLTGLPQLRFLRLHGTKVTDAGVAKLQQALPKCKIAR
jgi:hypothetical protein